MTHKETSNSYKILAGKHNEKSTWEPSALVEDDFKREFRDSCF